MRMRSIVVLLFFVSMCIMTGCTFLDLEDPNTTEKEVAVGHVNSFFTKNHGDEGLLYYYYFDERIFLKERKNMLLVCFTDNVARKEFVDGIRSVSFLQVWNPSQEEGYSHNILVLETVGGEDIPEDLLNDINDSPDVRYISPIIGDNNQYSSVSDEFSVKLRGSSLSRLSAISREYGCDIMCYDGFGEGIYFVRRSKDSVFGTIQLASLFYETGAFEFTTPGFFNFNMFASSDPLYSDQWSLKNTGQHSSSGIDIKVEDAWEITEGSSDILVAVLDSGVDLIHPDLSGNLVNGYDAVNIYSGLNGAPPNNGRSHGTSVAGIIGALKDNMIGISGIAPACKIMPVCVGYSTPLYNPEAVRGFNWACSNGADVINCSWGGGNPDATLTSAIQNAVTQGRDGKGCVVVFAAGNAGAASVQYPASLGYVLAVGAISYDGYRKTISSPDYENWGSNYGSALNVVAPGVLIPTTEWASYIGYSGSGYVTNFNGTSSATPHVSGIAALLLSEYPNLEQYEIRRLIETGCTKLSGYGYYDDGNYPPYYKNTEVGYGLVNAYGSFNQAEILLQQKALDSISGIDFTIQNNSSYLVDEIYLELTGDVGGVATSLICEDCGSVSPGKYIGYPVYRGINFSATPGSAITNLQVEFYARAIDCPGNLRIGVEIDNSIPTYYNNITFGWGNTFYGALASSTVPSGYRRRLYINILDPV